MSAEHEAAEHGVVGGLPAVAAEDAQVFALGVDDFGEPGEVDGGVVDVGRADPGAVAQADVAVVGQEPGHLAAGVPGVAAVAAGLGLVAEQRPVGPWCAQFGQGSGEGVDGAPGERGEAFGADDAAHAAGPLALGDLCPEVVDVEAVKGGQASDVGGGDLVPGRWNGIG
ncbi:hypothetical protein [Streptomyces sp. NPDC001275]